MFVISIITKLHGYHFRSLVIKYVSTAMRNYKRSEEPRRPWKKHLQSDIDAALHSVREGSSIRRAAKRIGMDESTLRKKIKRQKVPLEEIECLEVIEQRGVKRSLPEEAEVSLAAMIRLCARWGFGLSGNEVKDLVRDYVAANREAETEVGAYLRRSCQFKVCNINLLL